MSAQVKPWLVLAVIFIAGILTGVALTIGLSGHFVHPPGEAQMKKHLIARYMKELNLTADQQAKIEPILNDAATKMQAIHHEEVDRFSQIFKTTDQQVSAYLTPDQKTLLLKLESDREKMFAGRPHLHGAPHDGPGGPLPAPDGPGAPPSPPSGATNAPAH